MQQLGQLDPANVKAKGLKNRVGKLLIQTVAQVEEAPAGDAAPAAPKLLPLSHPPPRLLPPKRRLLRNSRAAISPSICRRSPRRSSSERSGSEAPSAADERHRRSQASPVDGSGRSRVPRRRQPGAIKSALDIDADEKAQLLKQADAALTDIRNKIEVIQAEFRPRSSAKRNKKPSNG